MWDEGIVKKSKSLKVRKSKSQSLERETRGEKQEVKRLGDVERRM